jgi:preprotein translocase subunit SecY
MCHFRNRPGSGGEGGWARQLIMNTFLTKLRLIAQDANIRRRILFTFGILILFRVGASIPIPGVNLFELERFFAENQFFGMLNIFSGGGLITLSIMMLGVGPFITASIIMQLMTIIFPKLKALYHEEGEEGRRKMSQYSRLLTIPLALIQGFGLLILLERQGVLFDLTMFDRLVNVLVVAGASILLMWLGELITEYGLGNGVSLIIFSGIVASLPATVTQLYLTFDPVQIPLYLGFGVAAVAIIAGVVFMTEAERPIPVTYAKQVRGMKMYGGMSTYLPIRLNNAGVMPIIFALSLILFPQMIAEFMGQAQNQILQIVSEAMLFVINNPWIYASIYFVLVFGFTYFYSAVTFDPQSIATNLQKSGAFIPGVRPGRTTAEYIARILSRLTLVGALFLGLVALLPLLMQAVTGIGALAIGGTALLIVVSVALDFTKQINAQVTMREY